MRKPLYVGLPVMLHKEPEIQAFLKAKERIESYGQSAGFPMEVGAFLFFISPALKPENKELQVKNQQRYGLPIFHAQSTWQLKHNLSYSKEQDPSCNGSDQMEEVIRQTAELGKSGSQKIPIDVSLNVGVYLCGFVPVPSLSPSLYTLDDFLSRKEALFQRNISRFSQLEQFARENGVEIALENAITAVFVPHPHFSKIDPTPRMYPHVFNDFWSMKAISNGKFVLDTAHWAAGESTPRIIEQNATSIDKEIIFKMEGINSWDEYKKNHPSLSQHFPYTKAFHLSNSTGIGVYLDEALSKRWGEVGTVEGIISKADFRDILSHASEYGKPAIVEVDYDIKNIPVNHFREADELLRYIIE